MLVAAGRTAMDAFTFGAVRTGHAIPGRRLGFSPKLVLPLTREYVLPICCAIDRVYQSDKVRELVPASSVHDIQRVAGVHERAEDAQPEQTNQGQSMVGIFWLIGDRLILDTSHFSVKQSLMAIICTGRVISTAGERSKVSGPVSRESEYEEPPRGRVVFNKRTQRFALYADRCILKRKAVVKHIIEAMRLPTSQTNIGTDSHFGHYKCLKFLETSCALFEDDFTEI